MCKFNYKFASVQEGQAILGTEDDYIKNMTDFEKCLKMNVRTISETGIYLNFLKSCVLQWNDYEIDKIKWSVESAEKRLINYDLDMKEPIVFIKTNGKEEWNSAYTRCNSIILPENKLQKYEGIKLERLFIHEFFHVISRKNPVLRNKMYEVIGYYEGDEIKVPNELISRKLTNPDAIYNKYYITLKYNGESINVMPIVLLGENRENIDCSKDILSSISVKMLVVDESFNVVYNEGSPLCLGFDEIKGLSDKIGSNMSYIDQPDEILSEYFTDIVMDEHDRIDDNIVYRIKKIFNC